jgi:hypothetical protein
MKEIVRLKEIKDCPGYQVITVEIEGKAGVERVLRKPDGTYWPVVREHIAPPGGNLKIEVGDQMSMKEKARAGKRITSNCRIPWRVIRDDTKIVDFRVPEVDRSAYRYSR